MKYENPNEALFEVLQEADAEGARPVILEKDAEAKNFGPLVVPPGEIFLLGDNRDASDDSRYWGTVPVDLVEGKVVLIWFSLDRGSADGERDLPRIRWERVFTRP